MRFEAFPQTANLAMELIARDIVKVEDGKMFLLSQKELMHVDAFRFGAGDDGKPAADWADSRILWIMSRGFLLIV